MTLVSIIVPAWNEAKTLKATLGALLAIDYEKNLCEVIVVAGGDDNTYEIAQHLSSRMGVFSRCVVICQERKGTKNAAVQQGIREANNEIIVLLDADTIVSKEWLKRMVGPIEQGTCDLTIANSEPVRKNWISDYYMIIKTYFVNSISTHPGHSVAFRADMVKNRVEYFFDEKIWMGDDYIFERRVSELGREIMFVKDANVRTHFPCSPKYFCEIEFRWLMAFISMNGINYRTLTCNVIVIGALVSLIPFSKTLFMFSLLFNILYTSKRAYIFLATSRQYKTRMRRIFGFVMMSYTVHIVSLLAHIWYLLGLRRDSYYQGQRY